MKLDVDGNYKMAASPFFFVYTALGRNFSLTPCFSNLSTQLLSISTFY